MICLMQILASLEREDYGIAFSYFFFTGEKNDRALLVCLTEIVGADFHQTVQMKPRCTSIQG